jgi:hypothetical protein
MKLRLVKPSAVLRVSAALLISGSLGLACASRSPLAPDPVGSVIVVEKFELDSILAKYTVSESRGEVTSLATCATHVGDSACAEAARQQLRVEGGQRGLGLVVINDNLLRPTNPAQIYLRATLHQITPR